ncbi:unnamed protein product [Coregonus sp. 'balchen']|nr:unnamed protein product [Coregonus sp. 'balchen']
MWGPWTGKGGRESSSGSYLEEESHPNHLRPVDESVSVSDLLDLSSLGAIASLGSSPHSSMAALFPSGPLLASGGLGFSPPSSSSTCLPIDIPGSTSLDPPDPSPPSSQSSLPSTTHSTHTASLSAPASAAASFYVEEGGDSLLESANHMMPPSATSLGNLSSLDQLTNDDELPTDPSNSSDTQEEDLSVSEWQQDSSSGKTNRILSYTIAINNPLGPKTAPVVETQTLYKNSAPGECYVVDSEVITSGIPYQDYFYTVHRYCLTSINKNKSRLRVSSDICYKKQPWSLVKALIEKNTWSGIEEYYRHMGGQYKHGERSRGGGNRISTILLIVSFILVVLVALNMLLFYKLYSLERAAHTLETWHSFSLSDSPLPQSAGEWAQVLQLQRQFHQAQLGKWQEILQSSVTLLDQMKQSLEKLHRGIVTPEVQQEPPSNPTSEN